MKTIARVTIHSSQFPEKIRRDLLASLRTRKVNHKFHYDSVKQTQKWLDLHQTLSPSRHDANCGAAYDRALVAAGRRIKSKSVHVIGLGCGGGQKDARLLKLLKAGRRKVFYTPCDVSSAMVLVARQTALSVLPEQNCFPFVCDLTTANDLQKSLVTHHPSLITFFGMIPNFEPRNILPKLAALLRPSDLLLFSANLAPGKDYAAGMNRILPQYDNPQTRDWLLAFLSDLGVPRGDGAIGFVIQNGSAGLKRIVASFKFARARRVQVGSRRFEFRRGDSIRLFFSYRYTPALVRKTLARHGLLILDEQVARSGEEGVFCCCKGTRSLPQNAV